MTHPGFTLNATKDPERRVQRLIESKENMMQEILNKLDQISCVNHEIMELTK